MSPTFEAAVEALTDLSVPAPVLPYLTTLRRLPDDIVLRMATRDFVMMSPSACVCGWAIREVLAEALNLDPETLDTFATPVNGHLDPRRQLVEQIGGTYEEWNSIFSGVCEEQPFYAEPALPSIELAFLLRVAEAAER